MPASALLVALALFTAPGRAVEPPNRNPKPGDCVTPAEFDRHGQPARLLVAVDRETFRACDGLDDIGPGLTVAVAIVGDVACRCTASAS